MNKKKIETFVDERTYSLVKEKAERCGLSLPEVVRELIDIGVGA